MTITDYSKYDLDIGKTFNSIDGDTLLDMDLPATKFVIKDLLPQGLAWFRLGDEYISCKPWSQTWENTR